jgi:hypothetical protein
MLSHAKNFKLESEEIPENMNRLARGCTLKYLLALFDFNPG